MVATRRSEWRKSSYSNANGGHCVQVALNLRDAVAVRDSKDQDGPTLAFAADQWEAFTARVKSGHFDQA
jgi:Domain of unknown function (DUF397)